MKRRVIVKAWLLGVFTTLLGKFRLTIADQITNIPDTTSSEFRSFIDTLLPEYLTPSGSQLGVHEKVLHIARLNPQSLELIRNGCDWLTAQA